MQLVAIRAFIWAQVVPLRFQSLVWVVGVDFLALYHVVFGALDHLFLAGVLVGHMAIEAELHLNRLADDALAGDGLLMNSL